MSFPLILAMMRGKDQCFLSMSAVRLMLVTSWVSLWKLTVMVTSLYSFAAIPRLRATIRRCAPGF